MDLIRYRLGGRSSSSQQRAKGSWSYGAATWGTVRDRLISLNCMELRRIIFSILGTGQLHGRRWRRWGRRNGDHREDEDMQQRTPGSRTPHARIKEDSRRTRWEADCEGGDEEQQKSEGDREREGDERKGSEEVKTRSKKRRQRKEKQGESWRGKEIWCSPRTWKKTDACLYLVTRIRLAPFKYKFSDTEFRTSPTDCGP